MFIGQREYGLARLQEPGNQNRGRLVSGGTGVVHHFGTVGQALTRLENNLGARLGDLLRCGSRPRHPGSGR